MADNVTSSKGRRNMFSRTSVTWIRKPKVKEFFLFFFFLFFFYFLLSSNIIFALPDGPDSINVVRNETKGTTTAKTVNVSGGRIATINMTVTSQNQRWKAIVGNISGSFTLDDASGSTIYDWSFTTVAGEVYATSNASTVSWTAIGCANDSVLETENSKFSHTSPDDNISVTFNATGSTFHAEFFVGQVNISKSSCPSLNTYVSNATQGSNWEEIALYAAGNVVYATLINQSTVGFDGEQYDFQMIVPEIGSSDNSIWTAYYLYTELS